jgi:FlaA1/EpsC-like NDP-sugar epimerase
MKYFGKSNTAALPWKSILMSRSSTSFPQYRGSMSVVRYALVALLGFNISVVIQLLSGIYLFPLDVVFCSVLFAFLVFGRSKIASPLPHSRNLYEINVADLLEREVVLLEMSEAYAVLKGQIILVTGAAGSIGSELCRQVLNCEPELLIALDVNETGLFDLVEGLRSRAHPQVAHLYPFIGDITDTQRMSRLFAEKRPTVVFHAAAYKHVPLLEQYPDLAIQTNALATYHLCRLAQEYEVARFVFISTDKAAEPVSVMGASKRLGEMIIQSLAEANSGMTRFCAVRFGNVIGSRGSVVPIFAQQIEQGGPLTVTDPDATRYFMTIPEACGLVILTAAIADSGGLYLLNMGDPVRILDLAVKMIRMYGLRVGRDIPIVYTGLRPGERLHETLVASEEELALTTHGKIFCVTHKDDVPTLATIGQWVHMLDDSLLHEDCAQLRELLFEIIGERDVVVAC